MSHNMYADALEVQNACNLSGILHSWAAIMTKIREEASALGKGSDYINTHPVNVLFADKVRSLTGDDFSTAYRIATEKAQI